MDVVFSLLRSDEFESEGKLYENYTKLNTTSNLIVAWKHGSMEACENDIFIKE